MKKAIKKFSHWTSALLAIFFLTGLNFCVFLSPQPVEAKAVAKKEKSADYSCHADKMSVFVHKTKNNAGEKVKNEESRTILPCCENHNKCAKTDVPREDVFTGQLTVAMPIKVDLGGPERINSADILIVDLPPPEAGLISSIFKRE
jgi:hypothetical protein